MTFGKMAKEAREANERNPINTDPINLKPEQPGAPRNPNYTDPIKPKREQPGPSLNLSVSKKEMADIQATIQPRDRVSRYLTKDILEQVKAVELGNETIKQINNPEKYDNPLPTGLMFEGPTGVGKTHLMRAIANETGCPLMIIPPGLFNNKVHLVNAVFECARQMGTKERPTLLCFDECDSFFTDAHEAQQRALKSNTASTEDLVGILPVYATNKAYLITEPSVQQRFDTFTFLPLSLESKKKIMIRQFGGREVDLTEEEWGKVLSRFEDLGGHAIGGFCANVCRKMNGDDKRTDRIVRFKDLENFLPTGSSSTDPQVKGMTPEAIDRCVIWVNEKFEYDPQASGRILLHEGVVKNTAVIEDAVMRDFGAKKPRDLRSNRLLLKMNGKNPQETTFTDNFGAILKMAIPEAEFDDNNTGQTRPALSLERTNQPYPKYEQVTRTGCRVRGWGIENVRFRIPLAGKEELARWVEELVGTGEGETADVVRRLLVEYPVWDENVISRLFAAHVKPTLADVKYKAGKMGGFMGGDVVCTFKHPSGTLVPGYGMQTSVFKQYYPEAAKELERSPR